MRALRALGTHNEGFENSHNEGFENSQIRALGTHK